MALLHHLKIGRSGFYEPRGHSDSLNTTAVTVAETCETPVMIVRDVSWLWRSAYNCAIQACSEWEDREGQISDIFDAARRVSGFFRNILPALNAVVAFRALRTTYAGRGGSVNLRLLGECLVRICLGSWYVPSLDLPKEGKTTSDFA